VAYCGRECSHLNVFVLEIFSRCKTEIFPLPNSELEIPEFVEVGEFRGKIVVLSTQVRNVQLPDEKLPL